jgi:hypothetical protein
VLAFFASANAGKLCTVRLSDLLGVTELRAAKTWSRLPEGWPNTLPPLPQRT